jgi:parallel beta-helix repeat protein
MGFSGVLVFEGFKDTSNVMAAGTIVVDCNGGGNYKTIQAAVDAAQPGDTVRVWAGTYYENVVVKKSISLIGNHSSSTIIDGAKRNDGISINADHLNLTGFTITNCIGQRENEGESWTDEVFFAAITITGNNAHIYENIIAYNSHGIKFNWYGSNNTIDNNLFYSIEYSGIRSIGNNNTIFNNTCTNGGGISSRGDYNKIFNNTMSDGGIGCAGRFNFITNNTSSGLGLSNARNNVISNNICNSRDWDSVSIRESHNNLIYNNTINSADFALRLSDSDNNIIDHNIFNLKENGIVCSGKSNVISNNTIRNGWSGIAISSGSTIIVNNTMINNHRGIFLESSQSAIIKNNKMISTGIEFWDMDDHDYFRYIIDKSNTVNGKPVYFLKNITGGSVPQGAGQIILINCSKITIENQNCTDSTNGITIAFSNNVTIRKNTCNNNQYNGILIWNSVYNSIENNTCSKNLGSGISVGDWTGVSKENYLDNNVCIDNYVGISVSSSNNNYVHNNNCSKNQRFGIYISGSFGNTLTNNRCGYNELFGIYLEHSTHIALNDNSMLSCGLSIWGFRKNNWNSHNIISSNTVNGKPIYYWKNKNGGTVQSGAGQIILANCQNIIIQNQNLTHGSHGIQIGYTNNTIIKNNNCSYNLDSGIGLTESSLNRIENNTCNSNLIGIELFWLSNSNIVIDNNCDSNNLNGIYLYDSFQNIIKENRCNSNARYGIALYYECENNLIKNNSIKFNKVSGIYLFRSLNNVFQGNQLFLCGFFIDGYDKHDFHTISINSNNTVNGKPVQFWKNRNGGSIPAGSGQVILANCSNINIMKQNLNHGTVGIEVVFSSNIHISDNVCNSNSLYGIYIMESTLITIKNNTLNSNNKYGIYFKYTALSNTIQNNSCNFNNHSGIFFYYYCSSNLITNNLCISNKLNGLELNYSSSGNAITNNTFAKNLKNGLKIFNSDFNKISFNTFMTNSEFGVIIIDDDPFNNNNIHHNNFINNNNGKSQALDNGMFNKWNTPSAGNYWSDYKGLDNGKYGRIKGDGIGDTYIIYSPLDFYPFINPIKCTPAPIKPHLDDPGEVDSDGSYLLIWNGGIFAYSFILEEDITSTFDSSTIIFEGSSLVFDIKNRADGEYYYRVKAFNYFGESEWSNVQNITVDLLPWTPRNFKISVYPPGNAINLSWIPSIVDTVGFEIHSNFTGNWTRLISLGSNNNTFNHTELINGETYYYRILARDARGQGSMYSKIISGIPWDSIAPVSPLKLDIISISNNTLELYWEPNIEDDLEGYNIYRSNLSDPIDWGEPIATLSINDGKYFDENLDENTSYYYVITAFDEVPNESNFSKIVKGTTLIGQHGVVINNSVKDFNIVEDTIDNKTINLYHWFKNIDNDPLTFYCLGADHIDVIIDQLDGSVVLSPEKNWNGQETLVFHASYGIYIISDNVTITVSPINDPPNRARIIRPSEGQIIDNETVLDFRANCDDPDKKYGDMLTYIWSSNVSGEIGLGHILSAVLLPPGDHHITLTVTDLTGAFSVATVNITVLESSLSEPNNAMEFNRTGNNTKENEDNDQIPFNIEPSGINFISVIISFLILMLILSFAIFLFFKNRKEFYKSKIDEKPKNLIDVASPPQQVTQTMNRTDDLHPVITPQNVQLTSTIPRPLLPPATETNADPNSSPEK